MKKYKINLHITEACNYQCKYCFAHFNTKKKHLDLDKTKKIIQNITESNLVDEINLAGGEPFCHPHLNEIIRCIKENNLRCSVISNGSLLTENWIMENAKHLETFGLSLDSIRPETMQKIGRCTKEGEVLDDAKILRFIHLFREQNPAIKIKVNTVLSKNSDTFLPHWFIRDMHVDRWKILRAKLFEKGNWTNKDVILSDKEWQYRLSFNGLSAWKQNEKYFTLPRNIVIEESLIASYLIVDPMGNLLDNSKNKNYVPVGNLLTEPLQNILPRLPLDEELYKNRYKS